MKSSLVIVTEHYSPSVGATAQLVTDISLSISQYRSTTVLTSTPPAQNLTSYPCQTIHYNPPSFSKAGIFSKILSGSYFSIRSLIWLLINCKSNDHILIVSNPPFIGLIGLALFLLRGTQYYFLFQDLFPRSAILSGILPGKGPLTASWILLMRQVILYSKKTIVLSSSMQKRCAADFSVDANKLPIIHNWAVESSIIIPKSENPFALHWKTENLFTIQYSGNFGRLHDLITILEAARLLVDQPIQFLLIGGGSKRSQILAYQHRYHLSNITLQPYQKRSDLKYTLGACDVALISTIPGAHDTVAPSKFYGIISSAKPVINISSPDSDISTFLRQYRCGFTISPGDPIRLAKLILKLSTRPSLVSTLSANASDLYKANFGKKVSLTKYLDLL